MLTFAGLGNLIDPSLYQCDDDVNVVINILFEFDDFKKYTQLNAGAQVFAQSGKP